MKNLFFFGKEKTFRCSSRVFFVFIIIMVGLALFCHMAVASEGQSHQSLTDPSPFFSFVPTGDTAEKSVSEDSSGLPSCDPVQQYFAQVTIADGKAVLKDRVSREGADGMKEPESGPERWSFFLPLMGKKAREKGYELPLPFGVSVASFMLNRDVDVTYLGAAVDGPPQSINDYVQIETANSVTNHTLRFDAWLLPFMNVYALAGYTETDSTLSVTLRAPGLLPDEIEVTIPNPIPGRDDWIIIIPRPGVLPDEISFGTKTEVTGGTYGGGLTFAGGYENFFITLDSNFTVTRLEGAGGAVEQKVEALINTVRAGWNGSVGRTNVGLWLGGQHWETDRTIEGSIFVPDLGYLNYKVEVEPAHPYNMTIGGRIELDERFWVVVEQGMNFEDMSMLMANVMYRF